MDLIDSLMDNIQRRPQILKLVYWPDERLSTVCRPITESIPDNHNLQNFMDDMVFTMQQLNGAGLAAPQVGTLLNVIVVQDEKLLPIKIINPKIIDTKGSVFEDEGCLSVPSLFTRIVRPEELTLEYFNENGQFKTEVFTGLLARAIQHECEHLEGKMFFERMNRVQKESILKKYKKVKKQLSEANML